MALEFPVTRETSGMILVSGVPLIPCDGLRCKPYECCHLNEHVAMEEQHTSYDAYLVNGIFLIENKDG